MKNSINYNEQFVKKFNYNPDDNWLRMKYETWERDKKRLEDLEREIYEAKG